MLKLDREKIENIIFYHLPTLLKLQLKKNIPFIFPYLYIRPIISSIMVTARCNSRCRICGIWKKNPNDELSTEEWQRIIFQLRKEKIRYLNFTGGEPLLREDLGELVDYAHSLEFIVGIYTNGYLLTEEVAKNLIAKGATYFTISLDALGEEFDEIRGTKGAFDKVINAVNILKEWRKKKKIKIFLSITIMKKNLAQIIKVVEFAKKMKIALFFSLLDNTPYFFKDIPFDSLSIKNDKINELTTLIDRLKYLKKNHPWLIHYGFTSLDYIKDYFKYPLQKHLPCYKSLMRIFINPEGKVFGGCLSMGDFGDLRKEPLHKIIHSQRYIMAQKKMFLKECPGCSCGYQLDLRYSLRHLLKEIGYRVFNKIRKE